MDNNNDNKNGGGDVLDMGFQRIEIDMSRFDREPDYSNLHILPTRNLVLFPGLTINFELGRESSLELATFANTTGTPIGIVCQLDPEEENPAITTGLYKYGVVADVLNIFERPDGNKSALVRARSKFRILGKGTDKPTAGRLVARVRPVSETEPEEGKDAREFELACEQIRNIATSTLENSDPGGMVQAIKQIDNNSMLVNFLCTNLPIETREKVDLLIKSRMTDRAVGLLGELSIFEQRMALTHDIMKRARRSLEENQKNAFLQSQMEAIRETLYGDSDETDELLKKAEAAKMPEKVFELFNKEIEKLRRYNPSSPDYSVLYSYLDILSALPWSKKTTSDATLASASEVLESDHYGLEKVKERIVEQLALLLHNPSGRAPILCLVGAPGVGKTSIGKSVARALGRKYERVSFGGLHDEAEIRGHRRTYIGAMPGRIIDAIKRAGVNNPVLVLDEIDKIGNDYKGDPAAALLEVLDPEQNRHFHDNYIDVDFDLSDVLFIATANTLSTIARPLLDRMEIIDISGYLLEEKMEIARRHLIPRILKSDKLEADELNISDDALRHIISDYTAESGVRTLEKRLSAIARKAVLYKMQEKPFPNPVETSDLYTLLGLAPFSHDQYEGNDIAGVVTGLAWTEVGGEILLVESSLTPAKTPGLTLTGKLGDVMKESATIAYQWVKAHAKNLGIDPELFDKYSLHIHFPEGAVPKDGPSAGITIATSIVSTFTQKRVAPRIAMTGEITLRGKVLPVGGIREKILAAKRASITDLIMSEKNRRDIDDMPEQYREGLNFHFVDTVDEVIALAILDEPVANPVKL
ncbi:MAG: endopeptidase La [Bacteroidales bacterium]|nr:endopeptidase La [Bacteroidales bacterium]